jgi:hypothetical protein
VDFTTEFSGKMEERDEMTEKTLIESKTSSDKGNSM